jgi:hypothetical protein
LRLKRRHRWNVDLSVSLPLPALRSPSEWEVVSPLALNCCLIVIIVAKNGSSWKKTSADSFETLAVRVARWFIFKPKIPIWVNSWGPWIGKCLYTYLLPFWIFCRHFGYFMTICYIWYILCIFGTFYRFWYHVRRKIWQPCRRSVRYLFLQ